MKSWVTAAILAYIAALSACSDSEWKSEPGTGGSGSTTSTTTTSNPWTTSTTATSTSTDCDDSGSCGDMISGCIECALLNNCAAEMAACEYDAGGDCMEYMSCIDPCEDQACRDQCKVEHPEGFELYKAMVICVICEECPIDCDAVGSGCPPPPEP